jgi:hypothetical protein
MKIADRVERNADALAFQIFRLPDAGALVDGDEAVTEGARGKDGERDERALLGGVALYELGARVLGDVELAAARHAVEDRARQLDRDEVVTSPV